MTNLDELRKLAETANRNVGWIGAGPTRHGDMISTSGKPLFLDSVYLDCDEGEIGYDDGYFVCSVNEHDYAAYIAAASPKVVLELIGELEAWRCRFGDDYRYDKHLKQVIAPERRLCFEPVGEEDQ